MLILAQMEITFSVCHETRCGMRLSGSWITLWAVRFQPANSKDAQEQVRAAKRNQLHPQENRWWSSFVICRTSLECTLQISLPPRCPAQKYFLSSQLPASQRLEKLSSTKQTRSYYFWYVLINALLVNGGEVKNLNLLFA